jgi:protein SCO1/2
MKSFAQVVTTVTNRPAISALVLAILLTITGCQGRKYVLRGQVLSTNSAQTEITVKHEEIPGFMPAMTMSYKVKDQAVIREMKPGDLVTADLIITNNGNDYWLEDIRITGQSGRIIVPAGQTNFLAHGEYVLDLALVNQDEKTLRLSDFRGQALLMTFVYTRCPMPNFCPRLSSQFARIHQDLAKSPLDYRRTHLLTVSFDPKYDTPPVLRKYGLAYLNNDPSGFSHWDFASANPGDLKKLAEAFGLEYFDEDNQITHTMVIVLINPDGTISKRWSTQWTAAELEDALRESSRSGPVKIKSGLGRVAVTQTSSGLGAK